MRNTISLPGRKEPAAGVGRGSTSSDANDRRAVDVIDPGNARSSPSSGGWRPLASLILLQSVSILDC
jgi:hypothetical protein